MTQQNLSIDHPISWDKLNSEFEKINSNFLEIYGGIVSSDLIPDADITYDLGSATYRFKDLYLSGSTIKLGNATISATVGGGITVPGGVTSTVTTLGITYLDDFSNNIYFLNDPWTAEVSTYGPFPEGAEIVASGSNPGITNAPTWDIQLDGSNFLSSLTLLDGGKDYPLQPGDSTDNLIISASYAPSTVINFDSPVLYGGFGEPRIIASTSDNPGQFATPGPFTASWTDGTRSVSIDYEVINYISNGLTIEYLRLVGNSSYSITGTFTGGDLVSDGAYVQRPELNFVIDPSDPTVLLPVVDWGTLINFTGPLIRFPVTDHVISVLPIGGVIGEIVVTTTSGVSSKLVAPTHSYGEFGDKAGMIAWDGTYLYYCTADYADDQTDVWIRVIATDTSW